VPIIAEQASRLTVFQRTPNFSIPARNAALTAEEREAFREKYPEIRRFAREEARNGIYTEMPDRGALDDGDNERRAKYDAQYHAARQLQWKIFDQAEAALGPQAERIKRRGILGLLYTKAAHDIERAGMSALEFEDILGCPREHLQAALWYLKGKGYIQRSDNGRFTITVAGFDEMESQSFMPDPSHQKLIEQGTARVA